MALRETSTTEVSNDDAHFAFHYDPCVEALLRLLPGATARSGVEVNYEEIYVRAHPGGEVRIPRSDISRVWRTRARHQGPLLWLFPVVGVHSNLRGVWWMNGSLSNLVALDIYPPATGRIWGMAVRPQRLVLSLEDPDDFIAEMLG